MNNMKVLHNGSGLDKLIKNSPLSAKAPFIRKHSALAVAACLIFPLNDAIANIEGYNFPFSEAYLGSSAKYVIFPNRPSEALFSKNLTGIFHRGGIDQSLINQFPPS